MYAHHYTHRCDDCGLDAIARAFDSERLRERYQSHLRCTVVRLAKVS